MVKVHRSLSVSPFYVLLWVGAGSLVAASAIGKDWKIRDAFDEVRVKMEKINPDNCSISDKDNLYLPDDSVSHHPDVKGIDINPILPNRTALLQLYNMALNRAFFWSYILQSRFIKPAINDTYDPGMMYYFLSSVADVSSNPYINASSIYFSPNMSYTSSYRGFFNKTMPRFAPRACRADINLVHQQKIPTLLHVEDLGAFEAESLTKDYTSEFYRINEWYKRWLPDNVEKSRDTKTTYQVEIRYVNNTNETFTFYGPPGNYDVQVPDPVKWTRPYYDCGRQNKWLVAAVSPVADIFPRHTHSIPDIEYPTYTAAVVMELDYNKIDINQCPPSQGNDQPNRFASTARCKENTECEPLYGWGFRRGGYQCRCAPGRRLPSIVRRPYLGEVIERAISDQYYNNFDCNEIIDESHTQSDKEHPLLRANYTDNSTSGPDAVQPEKLNEALKFMRAVQPHNCAKYHPKELFLNVDIAKGAEEQLGIQANMALRLANFISAFLQVSDPREVFSGNRVADKPLSEDQMFGETLAVVLGDSKIRAAGTFWDRNKFTNRAFFAPFAYKQESNTRKFKLEDLARLNKTEELYTNKPWFHILKQRWSINYDSLEKIFLKMKIRDDEAGKYLKKYERYPTFYRAANLKHGHWTRPYFDCDGHLKQWVITYAAPFFGWDNAKVKLEFKGVVAVTMSLTSLDINQCPDKYYVPNAFKGTDKCDRSSSYADQVQTPASGGGEGAPAVAKPETAVAPPKVEAPEDVKPEVKPDEYKEVKPLPTEVQPAPPVVQTEQPKEVKLEEPKEVKTEVPPVPESKVEATQETKVEATQETKVEATQETKVEATQETKVEATQETKVEATQEVSKPANGVESIAASKDEDDWQQRECELLKKISELEKVKKERTQDSYLLELKVREEEIDLLKARVKNLETELQAALSKPSGKNHEMIENIKQQHEELLSKARGMIFDKTKMVKNQELQIEALTSQIQSLKDINQITKDLLEIRNSEIKAMEDRLHAMEARFKAEKDRYGLVLQRAQTSSNINDDLRKEYETQLVLFKELREKYDQRVQALVAENERLKASLAPANGAGTSG